MKVHVLGAQAEGPFPKRVFALFFALLCPSRLGWGTSSAQRQKGPSGYLMSITVFCVWCWWHQTPGHRHTHSWAVRQSSGIPCARRESPRTGLDTAKGRHRGSFGSGQKFPEKPKKPREKRLLDRQPHKWGAEKWLPRTPTGMIFWEMSTTSVSKILHNILTQGHLEVWEVFFPSVQY